MISSRQRKIQLKEKWKKETRADFCQIFKASSIDEMLWFLGSSGDEFYPAVHVFLFSRNEPRANYAQLSVEPPPQPSPGRSGSVAVRCEQRVPSSVSCSCAAPTCLQWRCLLSQVIELQTIHQFSQSRRRPLIGPSPGWKCLLALSHLRHFSKRTLTL